MSAGLAMPAGPAIPAGPKQSVAGSAEKQLTLRVIRAACPIATPAGTARR
jgi:hypothetical protein